MEAPMNAHDKGTARHRARLFRNGRSQAVRIPKGFEFEGDEVLIEKDEREIRPWSRFRGSHLRGHSGIEKSKIGCATSPQREN
jgi:virulence-associated protein VagC